MNHATDAEARFDAAATRFRTLGQRWQKVKTRLDRAVLRNDTQAVLRLRRMLDAIDVEVDYARDALHEARRNLPIPRKFKPIETTAQLGGAP